MLIAAFTFFLRDKLIFQEDAPGRHCGGKKAAQLPPELREIYHGDLHPAKLFAALLSEVPHTLVLNANWLCWSYGCVSSDNESRYHADSLALFRESEVDFQEYWARASFVNTLNITNISIASW